MAAMLPPRPERADDFAGWERYHAAQAERLAQAPAAADLATRIGQLQGEMDHHAAALGYRELIEQERLQRIES